MERALGESTVPDALEAPGVTVERMRAFAAAARTFHEAAPWRCLTDEDLIHVEAPDVAPGLRHVTVLGAAGQSFGLGFFDSARAFEALQEEEPTPDDLLGASGRWSVIYGTAGETPFGDLDLWEQHDFPWPARRPIRSRCGSARPAASSGRTQRS